MALPVRLAIAGIVAYERQLTTLQLAARQHSRKRAPESSSGLATLPEGSSSRDLWQGHRLWTCF
ncbi:MAG: hypothetical protein M1118_03090 [Chloroflexi bacterium]|nr:hypothetical protein [Chloroflexota bacterium]